MPGQRRRQADYQAAQGSAWVEHEARGFQPHDGTGRAIPRGEGNARRASHVREVRPGVSLHAPGFGLRWLPGAADPNSQAGRPSGQAAYQAGAPGRGSGVARPRNGRDRGRAMPVGWLNQGLFVVDLCQNRMAQPGGAGDPHAEMPKLWCEAGWWIGYSTWVALASTVTLALAAPPGDSAATVRPSGRTMGRTFLGWLVAGPG